MKYIVKIRYGYILGKFCNDGFEATHIVNASTKEKAKEKLKLHYIEKNKQKKNKIYFDSIIAFEELI